MVQWTFQLSDTKANQLDVIVYGNDYEEVIEKLNKLNIPCIESSTCLINVLELKEVIKSNEIA